MESYAGVPFHLPYAALNESTKMLTRAMNISAAVRMITELVHPSSERYPSTRDVPNDCVSFVSTFVTSRLLRPPFDSEVALVGLSPDTLSWLRMGWSLGSAHINSGDSSTEPTGLMSPVRAFYSGTT